MLSKVGMYKELAEIIKYHHSRYDGMGYPKTKSPDEIPMLSHIMIVADSFDAMTTNRIYKPRKEINEAIEEIVDLSGIQFHPDVVKVASVVLKNIKIEQTSQEPNSELEKKRFSYFFQDALTDLHNESYLQVLLSNPERKCNCANLLLLRDFSLFNRREGWEKGNQFLIQIAQILPKMYPNTLIFRHHGDDFVILSSKHQIIEENNINDLPLFKENNVYVELKHLDLEQQRYDTKDLIEY